MRLKWRDWLLWDFCTNFLWTSVTLLQSHLPSHWSLRICVQSQSDNLTNMCNSNRIFGYIRRCILRTVFTCKAWLELSSHHHCSWEKSSSLSITLLMESAVKVNLEKVYKPGRDTASLRSPTWVPARSTPFVQNVSWKCQRGGIVCKLNWGRIQRGKNPLEKLPENPPETPFWFNDMSKLPIFGLFPA